MAIKGFLSGKSQSGGAIISIIDLDVGSAGKPWIEKYLVIQMEAGFVILLVKYQYGEEAMPAITLVKQAPKLMADCICANLQPPGREEKPSFWIAKDNILQLLEIDLTKQQKLVPIKG